MKFGKILGKVLLRAVALGFTIKKSDTIDPYFKGDLDGQRIWINTSLTNEESLFNVLHLIGHSIQWNVDPALRALGDTLHVNPSVKVLKELQEYEWQANCYALQLLVEAKLYTTELDNWLYDKYVKDMLYLTNFYVTGEKSKYITPLAIDRLYAPELEALEIPEFIVKVSTSERTRNGIVI